MDKKAQIKAAFDQLAEHPDVQAIDPATIQALIALFLQLIQLFLKPKPQP